MRMIREEGLKSLFPGVGANSTRAMLMKSLQLGSYDFFKQFCLTRLKMKDSLLTHVTMSLAAGLVATTICSPADVIKNRIMRGKQKVSLLSSIRSANAKEGFM
jgi:solute carrier family 25 (mitochondrial dicarboxylate transporter), member 10